MEHLLLLQPSPSSTPGCCPAPSSLPHGAVSNSQTPPEQGHLESCGWGVSNPPSIAQPQRLGFRLGFI